MPIVFMTKLITLSIIETSKGLKFGVFLEVPFTNSEIHTKDDNCFIFSFDLRKIYNGKIGKAKLNDFKDRFLDICYQTIHIENSCLTSNTSYICDSDSFLGFIGNYELNYFEQYFTVKEMETF